MNAQMQPAQTPRPPFGSVLADTMAVATYRDGRWSDHEVRKVGPIEISPAAHVLHYCSTCFEGFKAYRFADGSVNVFRMDRHVERMRQSARALALPEPDAAQLTEILTREGIEVKRFESAPGRAIVLARLKGDGTGGPGYALDADTSPSSLASPSPASFFFDSEASP